MRKIKRPVLRYFGGKFILAKWIISNFPEHRTYVEPFGGAASVLMQKPISYAEVYNDIWDEVVTLFRVLRDSEKAKILEEKVKLTPFARSEFKLSYEPTDDEIETSRRLLFRSFAGFGSNSCNPFSSTGFRSNVNRPSSTPCHNWRDFYQEIESFTNRLKDVIIENQSYEKILEKYDSDDTLFYIDPPYVSETRNKRHAYVFEFSDEQHLQLLLQVKSLNGKVILSGYDTDIYNDTLTGFNCIRKQAFADSRRERTECLWIKQ